MPLRPCCSGASSAGASSHAGEPSGDRPITCPKPKPEPCMQAMLDSYASQRAGAHVLLRASPCSLESSARRASRDALALCSSAAVASRCSSSAARSDASWPRRAATAAAASSAVRSCSSSASCGAAKPGFSLGRWVTGASCTRHAVTAAAASPAVCSCSLSASCGHFHRDAQQHAEVQGVSTSIDLCLRRLCVQVPRQKPSSSRLAHQMLATAPASRLS